MLPVSIIGIILNVVSAFELGRDKTMRQTTRFLLQMLAVADCTSLVSAICSRFSTIIISTNLALNLRDVCLPYLLKYFSPLSEMTLNSAVWMVVLVTAEQYVAICWPLYAPRYITMSHVRLAVGINWFVSFALYVVLFFRLDVNSRVVEQKTRNQFIKNAYYNQLKTYKRIVHSITILALPLLFLCFFNMSIVKAVRKSSAVNREKLLVRHNRPIDNV